ncbi:hypothetical protein [Kribbella sp. CA-294648]|uniref:hypothetical protein n=1 Tax=Kribbella sp. CA-294648 TaxID=3239948 RepID=UPI003D8C888C
MDEPGGLVPRDSPTYREFVRLYRLAQDLRPTGLDRWNGDLYATSADHWGGFHAKAGHISLSGPLVLQHLTDPTSTASQRAEALATVLHEATHAGMETDAPNEPNAVRTEHSRGALEGFAELRTVADFETFAASAGYPHLRLTEPQYPGAFAAMDSLALQASGPAKDRTTFIAEGTRGPAVMHFDQLADGVLRNRLADVVPFRQEHRRAVRAALIAPMLHRGWPILKDSSREVGEKVADEIRGKLNSTVEEIRRHYRAQSGEAFPSESPNPQVDVVSVGDRPAAASSKEHPEMRFLGGQAGAAGATRWRPVLGDGGRGRDARVGPATGRDRGSGRE